MFEAQAARQSERFEPCFHREIHPAPSVRYLRPEEYPLWDALVSASPQGTVLCRSWLLDAIPGDVRVLGYFNAGRLVAGIPLYFERFLGMKLCRMPRLVPVWGVIMPPLEGRAVTVAARETEILTAFAAALKRERLFIHCFHPTLLNWLPFYWSGFRQTTHFTYVLDDLTDPDRLWDGFAGDVRTHIRKAEKAGIVVVPCDADTIAAVAEGTFRRQHMPVPYSRDYLRALYHAALTHDAGAAFAAIDRCDRVHAASFNVWCPKRAYGIAKGTDPELRGSGADSLLTWHWIQFLASRARTFDFGGSVVQPIAQFLRGFGAKLVPFNRILKIPRPVDAALMLAGRV